MNTEDVIKWARKVERDVDEGNDVSINDCVIAYAILNADYKHENLKSE